MDIELEDPDEVVPEGITFAPVHFLTIPSSREIGETLENSNDIHTIVKLTKNGDGFDLKTYGEFKEVVSKYCFETKELVGQKLCKLTTASWLSKGGEPKCEQSPLKTILVSKYKKKSGCNKRETQSGMNIKSYIKSFVSIMELKG